MKTENANNPDSSRHRFGSRFAKIRYARRENRLSIERTKEGRKREDADGRFCICESENLDLKLKNPTSTALNHYRRADDLVSGGRCLFSDGQPNISGHFVRLHNRLQWYFLMSPGVPVISFARLAISSGRWSRFTLFPLTKSLSFVV
ncbi:hypothetical protein QYF36_018536 [Acer negundo]|nr:hypothetical protein QYF36_018536 [Acer negundo]